MILNIIILVLVLIGTGWWLGVEAQRDHWVSATALIPRKRGGPHDR
jgi:hypothetical protein